MHQFVPYTGAQVVQNASRLVNTFTEKGAFVVLVRVASVDGKDMLKPSTDIDWKINLAQFPEGWDRFVPELEGIEQKRKILCTKSRTDMI